MTDNIFIDLEEVLFSTFTEKEKNFYFFYKFQEMYPTFNLSLNDLNEVDCTQKH